MVRTPFIATPGSAIIFPPPEAFPDVVGAQSFATPFCNRPCRTGGRSRQCESREGIVRGRMVNAQRQSEAGG